MNRAIYKKIANKLNLPINKVIEAYNYYWKFYVETLGNIPLNPFISKEEFSKLKTSFNIHQLGKLYVPYERCYNLAKSDLRKDEYKRFKENQTTVH